MDKQNKRQSMVHKLNWQYLKGLNTAKDETVDVNMEHLISCTQHFLSCIILLLRQCLNTMMYHRRCNDLSAINSYTECKAILKETLQNIP